MRAGRWFGRSLRATALAFPAWVLASSLTVGLAAQVSIEGRVVDDEDQPVADAVVQLQGSGRAAVTTLDGLFLFSSIDPGPYVVTVHHIAYGSHSDSVDVSEGSDLWLDIRVTQTAIVMEPLTVEARSRLERERRGRGSPIKYIDRAQLEEAEGWALHLGDVLSRYVPGISVDESRMFADNLPCIQLRRPTSLIAAYSCHPPTVIVDGVRVSNPRYYLANAQLRQLASVEVLSAAEAGARYGSDAGRGVVLVRTRRGAMSESSRSLRPGRKAYDWSLEPQGHPWAKALAAGVVGSGLGLVAAHLASGDCSPLSDLHGGCSTRSSVIAGVSVLVVPVVTSALGAHLFGRTEISRGDFLRTGVLAGVAAVPGFFFARAGEPGEEFQGSQAFGHILILGVMPMLATFADRVFRSPRSP